MRSRTLARMKRPWLDTPSAWTAPVKLVGYGDARAVGVPGIEEGETP